ncbi:PilN domain-containing protein [Acetonema longum]|uniref:PilN domain-containing protein n=1 Tax=Acetonema longum TaxID=2374 RepID=UPI000310933D|nr:PilN domain-containing protein [Acetonema longum]
MLWFYLAAAYRIHTLETGIMELRVHKTLLQPTELNYQLYHQKQQAVRQKEDLLIKLTRERTLFYTPIAQLSHLIPKGVWLNSVSVAGTGTGQDPATFRILGITESYIQLNLFLQNLHSDPMFESTLNKVDLDDQSTYYRFEIIGKIKEIQ